MKKFVSAGTVRIACLIGTALAGLTIIGGGQAHAVSAGCAATNGGGLNFTGSYANGNGPTVSGFAKGDVINATFTQTVPTGTSTVNIYAGNGTNLTGEPDTSNGTYTLTWTVAGTNDTSLFLNVTDTTGSYSATCTPAPAAPTGPPTDSLNLRSLEFAATKTVATISGQVITGAVEDGIDDAFRNGTTPIAFGPTGIFLSFAGEPQRDPATQEALDALAYIDNSGTAYKAPHTPSFDPGWSAWADLRGTGFDRSSAGTNEEQINVTTGVSKKLSPNFLVGLFTGYEDFSFTMSSIAGMMTGNGGTIGSYAAWHFTDHWRADAMVGWTDMFYDGTAGTASGSFTGSRWLGSGGFTGTYGWGNVVLEPSARIYTLWERDSAFTDTLGTAQAVNNFSASRVSAGDKISFPWQSSSTWVATPYVGLYADYRFSTATALPVAIPFVGIQNGWSGRVTGGVTMTTGRAGPSFSLGGELGGLGAGYGLWSASARANWPF